LENARQKNSSIPLAHLVDETLTIERAYRVQHEVVRRELGTRAPVGFKAGLTSPEARARFRSDEAIAGVLTFDPLSTGSSVKLAEFPGSYLEVEVAMRIGRPIHHKLNTIDELKAHVDGIAPAIELPNLDYANADQMNVVDIIASNVAAAHFIVGEFASFDSRDPNRLRVRLTCNQQLLNEAQGRDSMGDQWAAALWLANKLVEEGWKLERGQIFLTGALGKMVKASEGECQADFHDWGTLNVHID
jgi:2-keto-4-pentenoate hydratase